AGRVISEEGDIQADFAGRTLYADPRFDAEYLPHIETWFNEHYTIRFRNYSIDAESLTTASAVACD
ncbi:MAG: formylmethanofuran dehydrogenase subunit A, partial [Blastopirellula sp. JB062]